MSLRHFACSVVVVVAAVGCKRDTPRPDPGPAAVVDDTKRAPAPVVDESGPVKTTRDPNVRAMHTVAFRPLEWAGLGPQREPAFRIHPFHDRMIVTQAGYAFVEEGGALKLDLKVFPGSEIAGAESVASLSGAWPDRLWGEASFHHFAGARQFSMSDGGFRRVAGKWQPVPKARPARVVLRGDSAIGAVGGQLMLADGPGPSPAQKSADVARCPGATAAVSSLALASSPSGVLVSVGPGCARDTHFIEHWPAGATSSTVIALPGAGAPARADRPLVAVASDKAAFVAIGRETKSYLARFDGVTAREIELPDGSLRAMWATPDGTLWVLGGAPTASKLHRLGVDSAWATFAPPDLSPAHVAPYRTLWARDAETAFLATGASGPKGMAAIVVSTKPGALLGEVPRDLAEFFGKRVDAVPAPVASAAPASFEPFVEGCNTPFVTLFDVVPSSPPDFGFPATNKALRAFAKASEIKLVEYRHGGKRKLGVIVPSREVGDALIAHVKATMKDESPVLVCHAPSSVREIALAP